MKTNISIFTPDLGTSINKQRGRTSGNTFGKVITEDKFYLINHAEQGFRQCKAVDAFAVSSTETQRKLKGDFDLSGDSGGLVLECKSPAEKVCSAIEGKDIDPNAIVCAKTNKCFTMYSSFF